MPTHGKIDSEILRLLIESTRAVAAPKDEVESIRRELSELGGQEAAPKRRVLRIRT
jgi:hypothetical protein